MCTEFAWVNQLTAEAAAAEAKLVTAATALHAAEAKYAEARRCSEVGTP